MAANAKVAIELYVDDKGTLRIKEFGSQSQESFQKAEQAGTAAAGRVRSAWDSVSASFMTIIGGIFAMKEAWDLANMAAQAEQERVAFANMAASYGANGDIILAKLKEVSDGTIDTMTMIRNAGTAMMMGIAPDDIVGLLEIAKATARQTGQTTVQAFEDISLAVGRQSKMILDNLGIILDVEKANQEYAKALGKTSQALTDTERKQAFMVATMKAGKELMARLGEQSDTTADKFQRFTAKLEDAKIKLGAGLVQTFFLFEGVLNATAAAALYVSGGIFKVIESAASLTDMLHITSRAAAEWEINTQAAFDAAGDLWGKAEKSFDDAAASTAAAAKGQAAYTKAIQDATSALGDQEKKRKSILAEHQKEAQAQAEAEKQMYTEAGLGADKYFNGQATELVQKAANWQKAGADIYATQEWLYDQLAKLSDEAYEKEAFSAASAIDSMLAHSQNLVDQYNQANAAISDQLDAVGIKVDELNGSNIGITATFSGGAVISQIDTLIAKFNALKRAANSSATISTGTTGSYATSSGGSGYENTDPGLSAQQVYENSKTVNINVTQAVSRSDIDAIAAEQTRYDNRA